MRIVSRISKNYNKPVTAECAALIECKDSEIPKFFYVCIYPRDLPNDVPDMTYIKILSFHLDLLILLLMFPHGDLG